MGTVDTGEIALRCAVCGGVAAMFRTTSPDHADGATLLYSGITKSTALDAGDTAQIFEWCRGARVAELHDHLKRYAATAQGLDAYCPACGKLYCRHHYRVTEEWDDGAYESSLAVCPLGHRRVVDR